MPLWMKTDVLYFNHPKVIQLPPVCQLLYLRAVAYSKLHLTDGYLSLAAVRSISYDLAASVQSTDPHTTIEEWLVKMVSVGLFYRQEDGVSIHDFLEWNSSKQDVEFIRDLRSKSGSKGGKTKELRKQTASKLLANVYQSASETASKSLPIVHSTEFIVQSTEKEKSKSTAVGKPQAATTLSDQEWLVSVRSNPTYSHVNLDHEFGKMDAWLLLPKNRARKRTKKFILNWINKIDPPVTFLNSKKKDWIPV